MHEIDPPESTPSAPDQPSVPHESTASVPGEPVAPASSEPAAAPRRCRLRFTGTGSEYFGIWIVNLLLTIVTIGIYSAWAKVRKTQYFYRNTQLDGSAFEYHGNPVAILKGRLLAVALLVIYKLALALLGAFALIAVLAVVVAVPWLLTQSYRFRLRNSSYRGLRFRFAGPVWQAYLVFGLPMLLILLPGALIQRAGGDPQHLDVKLAIEVGVIYFALAVIWPYAHFSFKRWQHGHAFYGAGRGFFTAKAGDFYGAYGAAAGLTFVIMVPLSLVMSMIVAGVASAVSGSPARFIGGLVFALVFYSVLIMVGSVVTAWTQNAVWSGTRLERVAFAGDMGAGRLMGITLGNILMVIFSLGLMIPFAVMRLMKYKVESIEVLDADELARFVGDEKGAQVGTLGEGAVDVMDFDFGL